MCIGPDLSRIRVELVCRVGTDPAVGCDPQGVWSRCLGRDHLYFSHF